MKKAMRRFFEKPATFIAILSLGTSGLLQAQTVQTVLYRPPAEPKWSTLLADRLQRAPEGAKLKVWVFFTDKGIRKVEGLQEALRQPQRYLTPRALRRRAKLGRSELINFADLPVYEPYVREVLATGARLRARSRWLNAVSVWATPGELVSLAAKSFVARLRLVAGAKLPEPRGVRVGPEEREQAVGLAVARYALDYGASEAQLEQLAVPQLHELGYSGAGVVVAMLDVGYYKDHEAFSHLRILAERDFVMGDDDTQWDPNTPGDYSDSHGTLTWSTLAGYAPGKLIGPAYHADFLLAKTEDIRSETPVEEDYWAAAAEWADSLGADVISSSLGYLDWYKFKDMDGNAAVCTIAADWAAKQGIAVVVAAGNWNQTGWGHISAPADGDSVISVGAVTRSGTIADFSSRGPTYDGRIKPEVCALGVNTRCATRGGPEAYGYASGTSLATPLIGGVCALLLEAHPEWTGWDVRQALLRTASQADRPDNTYGWGIANAFAASGIHAAVPAIGELLLAEPDTTANGVVDPGERLRLSLTVENIGDMDGDGELLLHSLDPYITVVDSGAHLAPVVAGGQIRLQRVFAFVADPTLPEGHVSQLELRIELGGRRFKRDLALPGAGGYAVSGSVWDFGQNKPASEAQVLARPVDAPLTATHRFLTDAHGNFSAVLPAGTYAFQAWAQGAMPFHAFVAQVPRSSPEAIRLSLFRPALAVTDLQIVDYDTAFAARLKLRNEGSGPLFVAAQLGPWPEQGEVSGGVWESAGGSVLWRDLDEKAPLDLSELDVSWNSASVRFDLAHWRKPEQAETSRWLVYLDRDNAKSTGDSLGSDIMLEVTEVPARALIYTFVAGAWRLDSLLSADVSTLPGRIGVEVPLQLLAHCAPWVPVRIEAQLEKVERWETFDTLPDSLPWRVLLPTFHPQGLGMSRTSWTLASGQTTDLVVSVSKTQSYRALRLRFTSWDPLDPVKTFRLDLSTGVVGATGQSVEPKHWVLSRVFPNPFNGTARFRLSLFKQSRVDVYVLDTRGRVVRVLMSKFLRAGAYTLAWDGRATGGKQASSGVYFVNVIVDGELVATHKLLYLR